MAKDIIVQDEYYRANHMSGVTRLRTELEEGGVCYWIPEDEAVNLTEKTVTENGTYAAMDDDANGYSSVVVNVPNTFGEHDEGRVVESGALVDQSSRTITVNGTYDTTTNNSVTVETNSNLSTKTITVNGTYEASTDNVDGYSGVTVSVPNTYTQSDEGKVVNNSELVTQSSRAISVNGTYDTTLNNSVTVETNSNLSTKTITVNGTYEASTDNVDGYSGVTVSVPNTYTQSDEGKVVSNSLLVSQSSMFITADGEYDTTFYSAITVSGAGAVVGRLEASNNYSFYDAHDYGFTGFDTVFVSVPLMDEAITFSENGIYRASDYGFAGFTSAHVEVPQMSLSDWSFSENGTYSASEYGYDGFSEVTVDVQPNVTYSTFNENGTYSASEYGYDGFSEITIDVQPKTTSAEFSRNGHYYPETYLSEPYDLFTDVVVSVPIASVVERTIDSFEDHEIIKLGRYAFAGCSSLNSLSLPACTVIESSAFYGCENLEYLCLTYSYRCVTLYEDPFSNANVPAIYVYPDLVSDYKNDSYWGLYSDNIGAYYEEENET